MPEELGPTAIADDSVLHHYLKVKGQAFFYQLGSKNTRYSPVWAYSIKPCEEAPAYGGQRTISTGNLHLHGKYVQKQSGFCVMELILSKGRFFVHYRFV